MRMQKDNKAHIEKFQTLLSNTTFEMPLKFFVHSETFWVFGKSLFWKFCCKYKLIIVSDWFNNIINYCRRGNNWRIIELALINKHLRELLNFFEYFSPFGLQQCLKRKIHYYFWKNESRTSKTTLAIYCRNDRKCKNSRI